MKVLLFLLISMLLTTPVFACPDTSPWCFGPWANFDQDNYRVA